MKSYVLLLRQFVRESRYPVDERAVADAILTRARTRLSANRADVLKTWLEQQIRHLPFYDGGAAAPAPARSVRRATARRASNRRAVARSHQNDTKTSLMQSLARHPGSTAGDLAKALNLDPESVSRSLNQLSQSGEIEKGSHGYNSTQSDTP